MNELLILWTKKRLGESVHLRDKFHRIRLTLQFCAHKINESLFLCVQNYRVALCLCGPVNYFAILSSTKNVEPHTWERTLIIFQLKKYSGCRRRRCWVTTSNWCFSKQTKPAVCTSTTSRAASNSQSERSEQWRPTEFQCYVYTVFVVVIVLYFPSLMITATF